MHHRGPAVYLFRSLPPIRAGLGREAHVCPEPHQPSSPTRTGGSISKAAHSQDCFLCSSAASSLVCVCVCVCVCRCVHTHLLPFSVPTSLLFIRPLWAPGHSSAPKLMDFFYPCLPRTSRKDRSQVTFQKGSLSSLWSSSNLDDSSSGGGGGRVGEGDSCPLQYSCLKNSMDRGAWWATVHGVTKSKT